MLRNSQKVERERNYSFCKRFSICTLYDILTGRHTKGKCLKYRLLQLREGFHPRQCESLGRKTQVLLQFCVTNAQVRRFFPTASIYEDKIFSFVGGERRET